jgi:hypothetical protein
MTSPDRKVLQIAARLRQYCADHPSAADTLEGVQRWWLGDTLPDAHSDEVEDALLLLVADSVIEQRTLADGTVLYFSGARAS